MFPKPSFWTFKGLVHRICECKVLILTYLYIWLRRKSQWRNVMLNNYLTLKNTKSTYLKIFKKCMKTEVNPVSVPWTKNDFPSYWIMFWKMPGLCTIVFKTRTWYLKFMLYHAVTMYLDCLRYFRCFPFFLPKLCSGVFYNKNDYLQMLSNLWMKFFWIHIYITRHS